MMFLTFVGGFLMGYVIQLTISQTLARRKGRTIVKFGDSLFLPDEDVEFKPDVKTNVWTT